MLTGRSDGEGTNPGRITSYNVCYTKLLRDAASLAEGADQIMTRLVNDVLQIRFADKMVSKQEAAAVYADVIRDQALNTPRKMAKKFGENLHADLVVVGTIWRFQEKGTFNEMPESPASIAFSVYLV